MRIIAALLLAWLSFLNSVQAQEAAAMMTAIQQYSGAENKAAVETGPATDPRPTGAGMTGESGGIREPWQIWMSEPISCPLQLAVTATAGSDVTIAIAGQSYTVPGNSTSTNYFYPNLKPYQQYDLTISGPNWTSAQFVFKGYTPRHLLSRRGVRAIPRPFKALINGKDYTDVEAFDCAPASGASSSVYQIELRPDRGFRPTTLRSYEEDWSRDEDQSKAAPGDGIWPQLGPGRSLDAASGAFRWSVQLGRLWNGLTAGQIRFHEQQIGPQLFNGIALSYTARSTNQAELNVLTNSNGSLRQIKAPQILVDIQSSMTPTEECVLRFYTPACVGDTNTQGLYQIVANTPSVTWRLRNPNSPGNYGRLQITEERPSGRTYSSEISYTSGLWQMTYGTGAELRTEKRTIAFTGSQRQETVEINSPAATVYKAIEQYSQFPWGWELTNVVTNPDGNGLTNAFVYHSDSTIPEAYGRLKERWYPGGRWELFCYPYTDEVGNSLCAGWPAGCGDFSEYPGEVGEQLRIRPWQDSPANPSSATLSSVVFSISKRFDAAVDAHESHSSGEFTCDAAGTGVVWLDWMVYADGDYYQPALNLTASDYQWRGLLSHDAIITHRYRCTDYWLNDLIRKNQGRTRETDLFEYEQGTFNPTNLTWTPNGPDVAKLKTSGLGSYYLTAYPTQEYDDSAPDGSFLGVDCVQGKSTRELTFLQGGLEVFTKLMGMTEVGQEEPVFQTIETRQRSFDSLGHLTNEVWIDGVSSVSRTVYQASWRDSAGNDTELQAWERNALGEELTFGYDSHKRLTRVTHVGVANLQDDVSTNIVFNVAGWLTQQTVSGGSLSLSRSQAYDLAGRLTYSVSYDGVAVTTVYSADTRTTTEYFPGYLQKMTHRYLDGRLHSVSGDTVVSEYHDYYVDETANPFTIGAGVARTRFGSMNSPRWQEEATGLFGKVITQRQPAFSPLGANPPLPPLSSYINYIDSSEGLMGDCPFETYVPATVVDGVIYHKITYNYYDLYGYTVPQQIEAAEGDYGALARCHSKDTTLEWDGSNWWQVTRAWESPTMEFRTNTVRVRLTGFASANTFSDIIVTDPNGLETSIQVTLDRNNKTLTAITNTPSSTIDIVGVTVNGLLQTLNSESVAEPAHYEYDSLRRLIGVKSPLGFVSGTKYDAATGWIAATTNASGKVTQYQYYAANEANAGKLKCQIDPNLKKRYYAYNGRGQITRTWGDVPYPEERVYDDYGDMTDLRTYRGGSSWASATWPGGNESYDLTHWVYDPATGLVLTKRDANDQGNTYNYQATRTLLTCTDARGVVTTYQYNPFGEILSKSYSDGTPGMSIPQYNSGGFPVSVTDALGTTSFGYDPDGELIATVFDVGGPLAGLQITNRIHSAYGKDEVVVDNYYAGSQAISEYQFDPAAGRLQTARAFYTDGSGSTAVRAVNYGYQPNSDLVQTLTAQWNGGTVMTTTKGWEYGYRLRTTHSVLANGKDAASFTYDYDIADRRWRSTWSDGSHWDYGYNDRNEINSGKRYWADTSHVAGQQFEYQYDSIGNRQWTKLGGDTNGLNLRTESYAPNALNQYSSRSLSSQVDLLGVATANAVVSINGVTNVDRHQEYFHYPFSAGAANLPTYQTITTLASRTNQSATSTGTLLRPALTQSFQYDANGNLTNDTIWAYSWDAENRLVQMQVLNSATNNGVPPQRLNFYYDYQGRRYCKEVCSGTPGSDSYTLASKYYFLYDGFRPIATLNADLSPAATYLWGLDLSGTLDKAGGIGGLLAITDHPSPSSCHFPAYDGNGNVVSLVQSDGTISARYEYSPFGEIIRATGPLASANPFLFSTKYYDWETGLSYYGYRYYSPSQGRFINHDPIEEEGGNNLYLFVNNSPIGAIDPKGQSLIDSLLANTEDAESRIVEIKRGQTLVGQIREAVNGLNNLQQFEAGVLQAGGIDVTDLMQSLQAARSIMAQDLRGAKTAAKEAAIINNMHHIFPGANSMSKFFKRNGLNPCGLLAKINGYMHQYGLHDKNGGGGSYNDIWETFMKDKKNMRNNPYYIIGFGVGLMDKVSPLLLF